MAQIEAELQRLEQAVMRPKTVSEADLVAEELAVQTEMLAEYAWDEDTATARVERPSGLVVSLRGDVVRRRLSLWIDWARSGAHTSRNVGKFLRSALESTSAILKRGGWTVYEQDSTTEMLRIRAYTLPEVTVLGLEVAAAELDRAIEQIRLT
jgi:hypothetical protein